MLGIPPSIKAYNLLGQDLGLKLVIGIITSYLSEMQLFVRGQVDPFFYNEKKALDFRQAFIQVYQRHFIVPTKKELAADGRLLVTSMGVPTPVYMYKVPMHAQSKEYMAPRGGEKTCYSSAPPQLVRQHDCFWTGKPTSAGCESKSKHSFTFIG